ncbi:NUDIX domain-containing protein [Amycolatopsis viridis]|uniref:NUDIX family NTP pyrophosphohydrolase n=1 Tax=Amycolatopsis viridis TaxID=185678 RepID=A0ABX0SUY3_9PSEU|nr:NUDIX domain-containing protein [Amycolatopsis viridis]NIH79146.1 putative NUDIX family NTP pyrophosphohydrolase [Amycolatopsis viridis]
MPRKSAAFLLYRLTGDRRLEVLIAHMGGPFWARKNERAWSIPKGEYTDEDPLLAARREFAEEVGEPVLTGETVDLGSFRQSSGKVVTTFAAEGDFDPARFESNTFQMEWPKGSGRVQEFPEVDRVEWTDPDRAAELLVKGQVPMLARLRETLVARGVLDA